MIAVKKKFTTEVDYNKSSKACPACASECEKINKRVNNRKLSEFKTKVSINTPISKIKEL